MPHTDRSVSPGRALEHVLSIFQHNCLGSWDVFLPFFHSFATAKATPDIVCLQDPPIWRGRLPFFPGFQFFAPAVNGRPAKVACYVSSALLRAASILPLFQDRSDIMTLVVHGLDLFGSGLPEFRIVNLYSRLGSSSSVQTVSPEVAFPPSPLPTLVVGDFNIHNPMADPGRDYCPTEMSISFPYFSRATDLGFSLLNTPGIYTRFPLGGEARPSVIDLAFASSSLAPFFISWDTPLPSTGSDHIPISLTFAHPVQAPPALELDWTRSDWATISPLLKALTLPQPPALPTRTSFAAWFDKGLDSLTSILRVNTPHKRPSARSKPWWSPLLTTLRKEYHGAERKARKSGLRGDQDAARLSKNRYFKAIKRAKNAHRSSFLSRATPQSLWTAKKLALGKSPTRFPNIPYADTPEKINSALLGHFFPSSPSSSLPPILRPHLNCPPLLPSEVTTVLRKCSPSSAPGP